MTPGRDHAASATNSSLSLDPEREKKKGFTFHLIDWRLCQRGRERVLFGWVDKHKPTERQQSIISSITREREREKTLKSPAPFFRPLVSQLYYICALRSRARRQLLVRPDSISHCWRNCVCVRVCTVCNVVPSSFPLASLTLSLTLGSSRSRSHTSFLIPFISSLLPSTRIEEGITYREPEERECDKPNWFPASP
jgi:hypothetical protein